MATGTLTLSYTGPGLTRSMPIAKTATAGAVLIDGETITTGTTDQQFSLTIDVSQVKAFWLESDRNVTVETNAIDASGGNTLNLIANEPYIWWSTDLNSFKLTADVTTMYITNTSGATATIYCGVVYDSTP